MTEVIDEHSTQRAPPVLALVSNAGTHGRPLSTGNWVLAIFVSGLFLASIGVAFHLNTLMIQGAYDVKNISVELNEVAAREATLQKEVIGVSTPHELRARADALGLVAAEGALHVDLDTGVITAPAGK